MERMAWLFPSHLTVISCVGQPPGQEQGPQIQEGAQSDTAAVSEGKHFTRGKPRSTPGCVALRKMPLGSSNRIGLLPFVEQKALNQWTKNLHFVGHSFS